MVQRLYVFAVVLAALCFGAVAAEAKVPIPCTSDKIVKVADLPKTDAFALPGGEHIDLAWLYQGCFSGKWVGTFGASDRYINWNDAMVAEVVAAGGMKALPETPGLFRGMTSAPGQFWVEWLFIVLSGAAVVAKLFGPRPTPKTESLETANAKPAADTVRDSVSDSVKPGYEAALKAAIAARANGGGAAKLEPRTRVAVPAHVAAPVAKAPQRRPTRIAVAPARGMPKAAIPAFGRRA
jgi:hypothetical protein